MQKPDHIEDDILTAESSQNAKSKLKLFPNHLKTVKRIRRFFNPTKFGTARPDRRGWFLSPKIAKTLKPGFEETEKVILASSHKKMNRGETFAEFKLRRKASNKRRRSREKQRKYSLK